MFKEPPIRVLRSLLIAPCSQKRSDNPSTLKASSFVRAVVVTIGPACQDVDTLCNLLEAGATCARCDLTVSRSLRLIALIQCQSAQTRYSKFWWTQWGPLEFHKQSLVNLQKAMHKTRKLCAIMVDTIGREILVNREAKLDSRGWPTYEQVLSVKDNDRVGSLNLLSIFKC